MGRRKGSEKLKEKIRVLFLTPSFPRFADDVYSPFVLECAKNIALEGANVLVVTSDDKSSKDYLINSNVEVKRFSYFIPKRLQRLTYFPGGIPEQIRKSLFAKIQLPFFMLLFFLKALPNAGKADVLHSHWVMPGIIGVILKAMYKKPLVVTVRENNTKIITKSLLLKLVLRKADKVIVNSMEYKKDILSIGVKEENIEIILNGVNPIFKSENKGRAREPLGIAANKVIIIYVGSLIPRKGPADLIEAFLMLREQYANLMLVYVGEGVQERDIKGIANNSKYSKDILFLGRLAPMDVKRWLNASDIFCLPTKRDGIPNVMVEAMACEVPVVMGRVGGIPEVIEDWKSGVMVDAGDKNQLCHSLSRLICDRKARNSIGRCGKKALLKKGIDWKTNAEKHIIAYKKLMEKFK